MYFETSLEFEILYLTFDDHSHTQMVTLKLNTPISQQITKMSSTNKTEININHKTININ